MQFYKANIEVVCFSKCSGRKKARPAPSTLDGSVRVTLTLTCDENAVQVQLASVDTNA